jgi:protease YdgD
VSARPLRLASHSSTKRLTAPTRHQTFAGSFRYTPPSPARSMNRYLLPVICGVGAFFVTASASSRDLHPGIIGDDDRVVVDDQGPPWEAVGQVNVGGYRMAGRCTGTLVAPDLVLTAAHCVMDPWNKKPFPLHDIHFLAAARANKNRGHSTAKCLHFPKGYDFATVETGARNVPLRAFANDAVAIVLNEKLAVAPAALADGVVAGPELQFVHAAYPADRRYVLSAHFNCHLLQSDVELRLWFNDCDTHPASSGGPLFTMGDGAPKLAAIMVGGGEHTFNIALPITEWVALTRNASCP